MSYIVPPYEVYDNTPESDSYDDKKENEEDIKILKGNNATLLYELYERDMRKLRENKNLEILTIRYMDLTLACQVTCIINLQN